MRDAINAALASAKSEGILEEDPVSILRKQKSSLGALLSALANATEPALEERQALAGAAQNTINSIDAVLSAAAPSAAAASRRISQAASLRPSALSAARVFREGWTAACPAA